MVKKTILSLILIGLDGIDGVRVLQDHHKDETSIAKRVSDYLVYSGLGYHSGKCPAQSDPISKSECQQVATSSGGSFTTITDDYTMGSCSVICGDPDQDKNSCAGQSPEVRWNTIKEPFAKGGFYSVLRKVCKRPCQLGFYKSKKQCLPYGGKCENGVLAPQEKRTSHNFCGSCNAGYYSDDGKCVPYAGSCGNGTLIREQHLRTRNNQCGSCNAGYYLNVICNLVGSCTNGKLVDRSVQVSAHQCGSCNDGYVLTAMRCKVPVAGYINGANDTVGCPTGTQPMTSAECQIAASQHNEKWRKRTTPDFPAGCFRTSESMGFLGDDDTIFVFNAHTTGAATSDSASVVCRTCGTCPQQDLEWKLNDIASTCPSGARNLLAENECRRAATSLGLNYTWDDTKAYDPYCRFMCSNKWTCRSNGTKVSSPMCTTRADGSVRFTQCSYVGDRRVCGATTSTVEQQ